MKITYELEEFYVEALKALKQADNFAYLSDSEFARKLLIDALNDLLEDAEID